VVSPTIWCIVPFSRPEYIQSIFDRFVSQTYHNKKLVVVENGNGVGTCKKHGLEPDLLLTSGKHQSWAKNEGILKLRSMGRHSDYWTTWDDDDYYGDRYLEELAANVHKGDVIGKARSFVKLTDDHLYLMSKPLENSLLDNKWVVHGPTITARVSDSLLFEHLPFAEDLKFVEQMRDQGADIYVTSKYNWCYMRNARANHTWQISDDEFKFAHSGHFYDYGRIDFDIVDGKKDVEGTVVYCDRINIHDSFTYQQTLRSTGGQPEDILEALAKQTFGEDYEVEKTPVIREVIPNRPR
jgi:glycosyltransferase involved in cell wall biosynthesis